MTMVKHPRGSRARIAQAEGATVVFKGGTPAVEATFVSVQMYDRVFGKEIVGNKIQSYFVQCRRYYIHSDSCLRCYRYLIS